MCKWLSDDIVRKASKEDRTLSDATTIKLVMMSMADSNLYHKKIRRLSVDSPRSFHAVMHRGSAAKQRI